MIFFLTAIHVIVCVGLIAVVLLQTGKRADLAGAFGGGGSQTAFGTRGAATFLSKATTSFAVMFMLTSIGLSIVSARSSSQPDATVLDQVEAPATETSPAATPPDATEPAAVPPVSEDPPPTDEGSDTTEGEASDDTPAEGAETDPPATDDGP